MNSCKIEKADFERVYDTYSDSLYRLALSYVSSCHDAEDVVQDVFIKYIEQAHKLNYESHIKAWLIRATINKSTDFLRKQKHRNHSSIDEIHHLKAEEREELPNIFKLANELPEKYKDVILLHYFEELSICEIASILKLSQSAVKMRLSRGREALKTILEKEENRD